MDEQLLLRFLSDECSEQDLQQINAWIKADTANADWLFEIEQVWLLKSELSFSNKEDLEIAFKQFLTNRKAAETTHKPGLKVLKRRKLSLWLPYAAAVLLISLFSINLFQRSGEKPAAINIIEVPRGQRVSLTLSDGTRVWLNSASRLEYPSGFTEGSRTVSLKGEAYFEVTKNAHKPFIVHSPDLDVNVLGTKFNVKSYPNEATSVKLKSGRVEVSTPATKQKIAMVPNDQVNYSTATGMRLLKNADVKTAGNWRNGELIFVAESLDGIAKALERKFDRIIIIKDQQLKNELFNCRVDQGVRLEEVLSLLKRTRKINYKLENDQVLIFKY